METKLEIEPLFKQGETDTVVNFEAQLEVDEDGEEYSVTLLGRAALTSSGERYITFDPLALPETPIGSLQRQYARKNKLFIVDDSKMDRVEERLSEAKNTLPE